MKKFFMIIPLVLSSFLTNAQEYMGGFKLTDKTLIWQEVYEFPEADSSIVKNFFYQNSLFQMIGNMGKAYITLKNYTDVGFGQRPVYFNNDCRFTFVTQIKNNRYRVTIQSIEPIDSFVRYNRERNEDNAKYLGNIFETYINKKGELKNTFYQSAALLDDVLFVLFNYKNSSTAVLLDDDF